MAAILGGAGRPAAAIILAVLLLATTVPSVTATQPARRDFAFDWPAIREAAEAFGPADAARFEANVEEELLSRPWHLIQPVPEPYVGVGLPSADVLFIDALLRLFKPHLVGDGVQRVAGFMTAFNKGRLAYAIESSRGFSGCILLGLTLEVSGGPIMSGQHVEANEGEYVLIVWSKAHAAPAWCRHHDRYSGYEGGYWRRPTGVRSPDATGIWPAAEGVAAGSKVPQTAIADIQRALANLGHRPGPIDGLMGRKTRDAIRQFQTARGLDPDGVPTAKLLETLWDAGMR
jgi:hypothetical protein